LGRSDLGRRRRMPSARTLLIAIGLAVSATFMYIAVRGAHPQETLDALKATDYRWLVPGLAAMVVAFFIRGVRWHSLFSPATRPPLGPVMAAQFVGYLANAVLPVRAGEAAAIVSLRRRAQVPLAEGTGTMLLMRAEDVLSLVLLLFVMLPWLPHVSWLRAAGVLALALLLVLAATAVVVIVFGERVIRFLVRPLKWLPFVSSAALENAPTNFVRGLAGLASARIAIISFFWTTLSWIVLGLGFWLVMKASNISLSPLAGMLVVIGIGLAMVLPSSPAALGVFEGATVVVLGAYDVPDSQALSYAFVLHALNILPLFVVAAGIVTIRKLRRAPVPAAPQLARVPRATTGATTGSQG
jgi:uncharacterized protein (TIRG00374 family)